MSILVEEAEAISSKKQDRSPDPTGSGRRGGSVQLLDAEPKKPATATVFHWFSPADQPPDSGEIDSHHTLFALLHGIYSRGLTGKLQLVFGRVEKVLFFRDGQVVFASSSDSQDGLGEVMLRAGALTQSQFEEASLLVETGQRFGSAIAEMGVYGVEEIIAWVRRQVIQVIVSVLDYPAGRYTFFGGPERSATPEIGDPVPLGKLLAEAVRKANDLPLGRLGEDADLLIELTSGQQRPFKAIELEANERRLLGLMFQRISAKDLIDKSGISRPEASRALYALLLLGFVTGIRGAAKPGKVKADAEPVVSSSPAALEESRAVEAPLVPNDAKPKSADSAPLAQEPKAADGPETNEIPEQRAADFPVPAGEARASETPSEGILAQPEPHLEEVPREPEEPSEAEAPPAAPLPLLKPNLISREVAVRATWMPTGMNGQERRLISEETTSMLVAETGGVIRLTGAVNPGQLLVLANMDTKREVIVQVLRKRADKPTMCYLEVEFVEAAPQFWGTEFSAATALLPKSAQDADTVAIVTNAAATADQPGILPPAPDASELQRFKRELEELRGRPVSMEAGAEDAGASAVAQLSGEVTTVSPTSGVVDPLSTEALLNSGMEAAAAAMPIKREELSAPWEMAEQMERPPVVRDLSQGFPMSRRWRMPRGSFTPGFRKGILRLTILAVALAITLVGAAWFKNWLPWKHREATKPAGNYSMNVASETPMTSPGIPAKSEPAANADAPARGDRTERAEAPVEAVPPSAPVKPVEAKNNVPRATRERKLAIVRPGAKPAADSGPVSGKESDVTPPKLIHSVPAVASLQAVRDFETGSVVIDAVVGTSGEVHFISVLSGPPSLRGPAVESLKQYKYEPAMRSGQPVPAHVTITIHFQFEP
ncbi:MAG TPA: DUF4388 domain-containing protein [Candidatus Acidoferrum sp.]|nr:DUF4388 domain-containing protein [Candidatus Acidoferrum sp.]